MGPVRLKEQMSQRPSADDISQMIVPRFRKGGKSEQEAEEFTPISRFAPREMIQKETRER